VWFPGPIVTGHDSLVQTPTLELL